MRMMNKKASKKSKQPFNMFAWGQKNQKKFAGIMCIILAVALLVSLLQF